MGKPQLLVVDDDKASRDVTRLFLRDMCDVDSAVDGITAIKKTQEKNYDIILMDIGLGREMNGLEAARKIRENADYVNVPIIAVTAYAMKGDKEVILESGCSHYLSKPFESTKVKQLVKEALSI
ncbi:MAG: response regulator [Ignavibacteriaceae bacterium]